MTDSQVHTERNGRIWIEREEQAKQGMARKENMRDAQASPSRPQIVGRGEEQGKGAQKPTSGQTNKE